MKNKTLRYGRVTVCGEYLMERCGGLCFPTSSLFLSLGRQNKNVESSYDFKKDSVAKILTNTGHIVERDIQGNLPLGYGFAGSTILTYLHLVNHVEKNQLVKISTETDSGIHGFDPSGVDLITCLNQTEGFYKKGSGWENVPFEIPNYSLVLFNKEQKMSLSDVRKIILGSPSQLEKISTKIIENAYKYQALDLDLINEYSKNLLDLNVYSKKAQRFIGECLANGYPAKGIGGLYDKAIIVFNTDSSFSKKLDFPSEDVVFFFQQGV